MTQIIVLTSSLLQNNQQISSLSQKNNEIEGISLQIRKSPGSQKNWGNLISSNLSNNWTFGLANAFADAVDPTKLGRLSNFTTENYRLNYTTVKGGLSAILGNRSFRIETKYSFEITTLSVENINSGFRIRSKVTRDDQELNGTLVYIFGIAGNESNVVVRNSLAQEENEVYIGSLQFGFTPTWAKIITIARYGEIFEASNVF